MSTTTTFLSILLTTSFFSLTTTTTTTLPPPPPPPRLRGHLINCGSKHDILHHGTKFQKDDDTFTTTGTPTTLNRTDILYLLTTLRYFPSTPGKHCYNVPVTTASKLLIRTTFFYGGFDGGTEPPIFDQIVDGTVWSVVNTTEDYRKGLSSYYEIVVKANDGNISVCFAANEHTNGSSPFVSAVEVVEMDSSVYNSTEFGKFGLVTIARTNFGSEGDFVRYPDDPFNRYWQPFVDGNPNVEAHVNVTSSEFWNRPPANVFFSGSTTSRGKNLTMKWPPFPLPSNRYYVALYFQDNRSTSPYSWRVFTVLIDGETFYQDLNVTTRGVTVYSTDWPLSGDTQITLAPRSDMPVGPTINAGEVYQILPLAGTTHGKDAFALQILKQSLKNAPGDWNGDPCLPKEHHWSGVGCSEGKKPRVTTLNLKGLKLAGTLPKEIAGLTALKEFRLSANKITGHIPDLSSLKALEILHLDENEFEGPFPDALGTLPNLREVLLNKNRLSGGPPQNLIERKGLVLKT